MSKCKKCKDCKAFNPQSEHDGVCVFTNFGIVPNDFGCHAGVIIDDICNSARADAIREFAEWLPKHFDLRFSNNTQVWIDEYLNHTSEKVIEQLKGKEL